MLKYNSKLKPRAQKLRNQSTLSEVIFWNQIKNKKLGVQFLRQKPIGNFIVDFYCPKLKLIIEIDGSSHDNKQEYDLFRDTYFLSQGLKILRFSDMDVKMKLESVVEKTKNYLLVAKSPFEKGGAEGGGFIQPLEVDNVADWGFIQPHSKVAPQTGDLLYVSSKDSAEGGGFI